MGAHYRYRGRHTPVPIGRPQGRPLPPPPAPDPPAPSGLAPPVSRPPTVSAWSTCTRCMRFIAALTDPHAIRGYLEGVGLPSRAPPIAPAQPDLPLDSAATMGPYAAYPCGSIARMVFSAATRIGRTRICSVASRTRPNRQFCTQGQGDHHSQRRYHRLKARGQDDDERHGRADQEVVPRCLARHTAPSCHVPDCVPRLLPALRSRFPRISRIFLGFLGLWCFLIRTMLA